jgi:hypothetical protein
VNTKIEGNTCDLISYTVSQFLGKTEEGHEELVEWPVCGFHPESLPSLLVFKRYVEFFSVHCTKLYGWVITNC